MTETKPLATARSWMPFGGDFDQVFNRMMRGLPFNWSDVAPGREPQALRAFEHVPKVEVKENGKAYSVTVELPGLDEKDVKVQIDDDVLTISGEKQVEHSDDKTHYSERSYGSFTRGRCRPQRNLRQVREGRPGIGNRQDGNSAGAGQGGCHQACLSCRCHRRLATNHQAALARSRWRATDTGINHALSIECGLAAFGPPAPAAEGAGSLSRVVQPCVEHLRRQSQTRGNRSPSRVGGCEAAVPQMPGRQLGG